MAAAGGPRLVVRNTFLEVFDDSPPLGDAEGAQRRPRAQTDLTDAKLPRKVSYPVDAEPDYLLGVNPTSPATASYNPIHMSDFPEEYLEPSTDGLHGKGSSVLQTPGALGPSMGMPHFPGFAGAFPPPWALQGFPAMGPGAPPPFHGMPWGYPAAPFPPAAMPQPQSGRGGGRRSQGEKGGKRGNGSNRVGTVPELPANNSRGRQAPMPVQPQPPGTVADSAATVGAFQISQPVERPATGAETTVMLRNIPNRYTQGMLLSLLDEHNFKCSYDFVYLPMDFRNGVNLGYAFVNLLTHEDALRFMDNFQGFSRWFFDSAKVCEVSWAHPHQGLHEHVERYRNSPVMHSTMPEEYKPMIFQNGERVPFPAPTKAIRAPKLRPVHDRPASAPQEQ